MKSDINYIQLRNYLFFFIQVLCLQACSSQENTLEAQDENLNSNTWEFDTLEGWKDGSQNLNNQINYNISNGVLKIYTRANTWDRPKIKTQEKNYKQGRYLWRIFVPEMGVGDKASVGAFIYSDDGHELDFEIGYGSESVRQDLNAKENDLVVYMTSQANPFQSIVKTIERNKWYTVELDLKLVNEKYLAVWFIDDVEKTRLNLNYGEDTRFYIFCSVENLQFIGDHIPSQDNYGVFDTVQYTAY
ncbi:hypothetical protein [uncultured Formosa sp.]|uniref:hypothetical protein n=1 Tax=uncultured Formosa sp. TaxID=255435 RepID=UPI00262418FD|nr:hypothetical protein [uncultured Formosa sp.]